MVRAAGYDSRMRVLQVTFNTGDGLMSADSKGEYMDRHIIGRYDRERVHDRKSG